MKEKRRKFEAMELHDELFLTLRKICGNNNNFYTEKFLSSKTEVIEMPLHATN